MSSLAASSGWKWNVCQRCTKPVSHFVFPVGEDFWHVRLETVMTDPFTRNSLLVRLQDADDVAAWEEFSEIYGPVIYRVALAKGLQPADAEDLVQEVFLAVSLSLSKWLMREDRGAFCVWLLRIARNEAIDRLRQRAKRELGCGGSSAEQLLAELPARNELSDSLDLEYQRALFRWAARRIQQEVTEQVWQAFWLTTVEGISIAEAAAKLNTNVGNIYVARSRVMARIKDIIDKRKEQS